MDFQRLQKQQMIRAQKFWIITRRQALVQVRTLLETGLQYVDELESQAAKKTSSLKKNPAKLHTKKPLSAYVEKLKKPTQLNSQTDTIRMHKQTVRHH